MENEKFNFEVGDEVVLVSVKDELCFEYEKYLGKKGTIKQIHIDTFCNFQSYASVIFEGGLKGHPYLKNLEHAIKEHEFEIGSKVKIVSLKDEPEFYIKYLNKEGIINCIVNDTCMGIYNRPHSRVKLTNNDVISVYLENLELVKEHEFKEGDEVKIVSLIGKSLEYVDYLNCIGVINALDSASKGIFAQVIIKTQGLIYGNSVNIYLKNLQFMGDKGVYTADGNSRYIKTSITYYDLVEKQANKEVVDMFVREYRDSRVMLIDLYKKLISISSNWANWLKHNFKFEEEKTYKVGQEFIRRDCNYKIVFYGHVNHKLLSLYNSKTSTVWANPVKVKDPYNLTKEDMSAILRSGNWEYDFKLKEN